jgi:hypothetical protein
LIEAPILLAVKAVLNCEDRPTPVVLVPFMRYVKFSVKYDVLLKEPPDAPAYTTPLPCELLADKNSTE